MRQLYSNTLFAGVRKGLLASAFLLASTLFSVAQIYTATLSGPAEEPPNASPGTGFAKVTINGTFMRVEATFSGLLGNTTASHIHAATANPLQGTAGVATTTPSFTGFPLGVTAGSYDFIYDMTQASSYRAAYIAANGGTTASAFAALQTALNEGKAYFNIHSSMFGGGEIRGFLVACPTINVTIPDAFALPQGTLPNTVYPAYAPASSLMLTANVSGGSGPYTFSWSNGSTGATTTVSPTTNTQYTVNLLDQNGCPGMASKMVNVANVAAGKKGDKIALCHNDKNSLEVAAAAVRAHLQHGDMLGSCTQASSNRDGADLLNSIREQHAIKLTVKVLPNPSTTSFSLKLSGQTGSTIQIKVFDLAGRMIETKQLKQTNQTLQIGSAYKPGTYILEVVEGTQKQTLRLVKGY